MSTECKCGASNLTLNYSSEASFIIMNDDNKTVATTASANSNDHFLNENEIFEDITKYLIGIILIIIILISFFGNLLVCVAIYSDKRLRKLSNLFLASLAVADLLVACLVMTFSLISDMMGYWKFGQTFCDIWIASDVMCCTASILNLCAISLDRFVHIKDPLRYCQFMTKRVIILSICLIWFLSGLISFLPISLGWHTSSNNKQVEMNDEPFNLTSYVYGINNSNNSNDNNSVTLPQCTMDLTPTYAVLSSLISFYLPCVVMIALYTRLYLYAKKHMKNIKAMTKPMIYQESQLFVKEENSDNQQANLSSSSKSNHFHSQHQKRVRDHKAAITVGIIMGVFLFCWVPFFCMNIIAGFCKTCVPGIVFKILTYLGWFNSSMNPIIYSIFNTEFREAFRRILFSYINDRCCNSDRNSYKTNIYLQKRDEFRLDNEANKQQYQFQRQKQQQQHKNGKFDFLSKTASPSSAKTTVSSSVKQHEVIPVTSRIEINYHENDGKISAI